MVLTNRSANRQKRKPQEGYVLLMLLLFVALLAITAVGIAPAITFQLRRDREEELVHRGVQYSRAVRAYYKKFGRYPSRIEDLEKTNNLRFLRRRYKDPTNGKDFKLLHIGEVKMNFGGGIAGATPAAGLNGGATGNQALVDQGLPGGAFGQKAGGIGLVGTPGGTQSPSPQAGGSDNDAQSGDKSADSSDDSSQSSQNGVDFSKSGNSSSPVFGGAAIVGVVSTSTDKTIREFNDKKHYNEWQFIYDPTMDRGGLLMTPGQQKSGNMGQPPGTPATPPGQPGSGVGQPPQQQPTPPPAGNSGSGDNDPD